MASASAVQKLHDVRLAALQQASESRDVDALMSWYSKDATFSSPGQNLTLKGHDAIRGFYTVVYKGMPTFKIVESKYTGPTPEFVAAELKCEGQTGDNVNLTPIESGGKPGDTVTYIGVSLFWWKWEGEGEWDGGSSKDDVRGWKIVEEHAYFQTS